VPDDPASDSASDPISDLAGLVPRQPLRLLEELAALSARVRAGEPFARPRVTLHLRGRDLRGQLLGLSDDAGMRVALLLRESADRFSTDRFSHDVTHVPVANLEALTVHDALRIEQPTSEIVVPGKLEVRRAVVALGERLRSTGAGFALETDDLEPEDLEPLMAVLIPLEEALRAILKDDLGREALAHFSVLKLTLRNAAQVLKSGETLELQAVRGFAARPNAKAWRELLEPV
jgi:hypothetical protein